MEDLGITEEQIAALIQCVTMKVLEEIFIQGKFEDSSAKSMVNSRRGRPKSSYTGQLHLRLLPEDAKWFKVTAVQLGVQHGDLFSMLRRRFS